MKNLIAIDLEQSILGAILLEKDAFIKINSFLGSKHFSDIKHQSIYDAMEDLHFNHAPIDILTVFNKVKNIDAHFIASLTNKVSSSANIEYHARIVVQFWIKREIINISKKYESEALDESSDVFELQEKFFKDFENLGLVSKKAETAGEVLTSVLQERKEKKGQGLMTEFKDLDNTTYGFKPSDLIILAARPGMGKTALVLQIALNVAKRDEAVLFFSLEMSAEQLVRRLESQITGFDNRKIETNNLHQNELEVLSNAQKQIRKLNLHIDDTPANTINQMKIKAQQVKHKYGLELIIVDYLQLATDKNSNNREQEVSALSRGCKLLAKTLNVPVIALSQLSRKCEDRKDKRPMLSDLRDSGAIEQDADIVMFLYRDSYYQAKEVEHERNKYFSNIETTINDKTELNIAKHRNGELKVIELDFEGKSISFKDKISEPF